MWTHSCRPLGTPKNLAPVAGMGYNQASYMYRMSFKTREQG